MVFIQHGMFSARLVLFLLSVLPVLFADVPPVGGIDHVIAEAAAAAGASLAVSPKILGKLEILDKRGFCNVQPWRFLGEVPHICPHPGRDWGCCSSQQVSVLGNQVAETLQFLEQVGGQRKEIMKSYRDMLRELSDDGEACATVLETFLTVRYKGIELVESVLASGVELLPLTFNDLLCTVCFNGNGEILEQLAREWRRVSRDLLQAYRTVLLAERPLLTHQCTPSFLRDLQVGPEIPHSHDIHLPIHIARNRTSFHLQWLGGLASLLSELPSYLLTSMELTHLSFVHSERFVSHGKESPLARADSDGALQTGSAQWTSCQQATRLKRFGTEDDRVTLVVPVSRDHSNDLLEAHAIGNWHSQQHGLESNRHVVDIVWIIINPAHLSSLGAVADKVNQHWHVIWRRYAPMNPTMAAGCVARCIVLDLESLDLASSLAAVSKAIADTTSAFEFIPPPGIHVSSNTDVAPNTVEFSTGGLDSRPDGECRDPRLAPVLKNFLEVQRQAVEALKNGETVPRALVYRCSVLGFCGGHGDRLSGIMTSFLFAVATGRAFFIDAARPVPLHSLLIPRLGCSGSVLLDWRVRGTVTLARTLNYNDALPAFLQDLPDLLKDPAPLIVLTINQRVTAEFASVLQHSLPVETPLLLHDIFSLLFTPSPFLQREVQRQLVKRGHPDPDCQIQGPFRFGSGSACSPWLALHFRSGDAASNWKDPKRHSLEDLPEMLACAGQLETDLALGPETHWMLFADTKAVEDNHVVAELLLSGKLLLASDPVHIDRSSLGVAMAGLGATWADWFLLASARGAVLSASGFGVSAAEVGQMQQVRFYKGCIPADVSAP